MVQRGRCWLVRPLQAVRKERFYGVMVHRFSSNRLFEGQIFQTTYILRAGHLETWSNSRGLPISKRRVFLLTRHGTEEPTRDSLPISWNWPRARSRWVGWPQENREIAEKHMKIDRLFRINRLLSLRWQRTVNKIARSDPMRSLQCASQRRSSNYSCCAIKMYEKPFHSEAHCLVNIFYFNFLNFASIKQHWFSRFVW